MISWDRQLTGETRELAIFALQNGMTLEQFWGSTIDEIELHAEAYRRRHDLEMDKLAWLAANVIAPHLKKPISPKRLLGKSSSVLGMTPEEIKEAVERRRAKNNG